MIKATPKNPVFLALRRQKEQLAQDYIASTFPAGASVVMMRTTCRACQAKLTLEEMHYFDQGDATATCATCEGAWMEAMAQWKEGKGQSDMPKRP
ncbi:MAG: hypothetical protein Q7S87_16065 [Agitococcus sp.]|nr:hypothetical protein [Agitococcus sp.]MDO9179080.1 hypothetical protein [Agitococcus sp.]